MYFWECRWYSLILISISNVMIITALIVYRHKYNFVKNDCHLQGGLFMVKPENLGSHRIRLHHICKIYRITCRFSKTPLRNQVKMPFNRNLRFTCHLNVLLSPMPLSKIFLLKKKQQQQQNSPSFAKAQRRIKNRKNTKGKCSLLE